MPRRSNSQERPGRTGASAAPLARQRRSRHAAEPEQPAGVIALAGEALHHRPPWDIAPPRPRTQLAVALLSWLIISWIVYHEAPTAPVQLTLFFVVLAGAITCTCAPIIYGLSVRSALSRRSQEAVLYRAMRQGALIGAFVVANGLLRLIHAWSVLTTLLALVVFVALELVVLMRK